MIIVRRREFLMTKANYKRRQRYKDILESLPKRLKSQLGSKFVCRVVFLKYLCIYRMEQSRLVKFDPNLFMATLLYTSRRFLLRNYSIPFGKLQRISLYLKLQPRNNNTVLTTNNNFMFFFASLKRQIYIFLRPLPIMVFPERENQV